MVAALIVTLHRYQDRFHLGDNRIGFVLVAWGLYQIVGGVEGGAVASLLVRPRLLWEQPPG